ncbi:MAG: hypothetical protein FJ004_04975 [Chloroflexi bacterium]|nr:hypothetical protein [Chloroflexota bacterium]
MFSRTVVTLNIESSDIRFLVVSGKRILDWGSIPLPPGAVKHGLITNAAEVGSDISELFAGKKIPRQGVAASLSGLRSTLRVISLPRIKAKLVDEAIQNECEKEMPVPLNELYLYHKPLEAKKDSVQSFLTLGVLRDLLDTEKKTLSLAGVRPSVINLKPLALARVVNREEALIINLEQETFDIIVVLGGIPVVMRTMTFRGEGISLQDRVRQLMDELSRTAAFYNASHAEHPLKTATPVFLTGVLANDGSAWDVIKAAIANPIEKLATPLECPAELPLPQYAVNMGLALGQAIGNRAAATGGARLNLVNPNLLQVKRKAQPPSLKGIIFSAASVALVCLLFFIYQMKSESDAAVTDILGELDGVYEQIAERNQAISTMSGTLNMIETGIIELAAEQEAYAAVPSASDLSGSLKLAIAELPQGVELISIEETSGQINLSGNAGSKSSVTEYASALEQTGAFYKLYVASMIVGEDMVTFDITGIFSGNTGSPAAP